MEVPPSHDPGPQALFSVVLEKFLLDREVSAGLIRRFFMQVTEENAGRAIRNEAPLDYRECASTWNHMRTYSYPDRNNKRSKTSQSRGNNKKKRIPFCGSFNTVAGRVDSFSNKI